MEWIALIVWIVVLAFALPLGRYGHSPPVSLGVQAFAALGGLALCIVFLALGHLAVLAWGATALGALGAVCVALGAAWLISETRPISQVGQGAEELSASLAGVVLPLFVIATGLTALMALDVGTVS